MNKLVLVSCIVVMLAAVGCSAAPAGNPNFYQNRAEYFEYLKGYNKMSNDLRKEIASIDAPSVSSTLSESEWTQLDKALAQQLAAYRTAVQKLDTLRIPDDTDIRAHYQWVKKLFDGALSATQRMQAAASARNQEDLKKGTDELAKAAKDGQSLTQSTLNLMTKYSITDVELSRALGAN